MTALDPLVESGQIEVIRYRFQVVPSDLAAIPGAPGLFVDPEIYLRIGNFEMDFGDGEVRYKSSLDFEGAELTSELISHAIYPAVQTMDRYLPGVMGLLYGDKSPAEAIAEVEGDSE